LINNNNKKIYIYKKLFNNHDQIFFKNKKTLQNRAAYSNCTIP